MNARFAGIMLAVALAARASAQVSPSSIWSRSAVPLRTTDAQGEKLASDDGKTFVLTTSDGGAVGTWDIREIVVRGSRVDAVELTAAVKADFRTLFTCDDGVEEPNIGALAWGGGSEQLIVIAEVPPHSSCPQMGGFMAYALAVPSGRIVRRYSGADARRRWGRLIGPRLAKSEPLVPVQLTKWPGADVELRSPDGSYVLRNRDLDDVEPHHEVSLSNIAGGKSTSVLKFERHVDDSGLRTAHTF